MFCFEVRIVWPVYQFWSPLLLEFYEFGIKSTIFGPKSQIWILQKAANRQFALCRHSRLGRANRRVMPSCVVLHIRHTYWFALSSHLLIFRIFNYLSADTTTLGNAKKIGHVTRYLIEGYSLCNLHFQVSRPITNPSYEAYFKAAYLTWKLKFACTRFDKNWLVS